MNARLAILEIFLPGSLRNEKLLELFRLTADAFRTPMPDINRLSYQEKLRAYAVFSRDLARDTVEVHDRESVKQRLFEGAAHFGEELRKQLHLTTFNDSMTAARLLYNAIGIGFDANAQGDVSINRCYFSKFYSRQDCELISSLDDGLIAGLTAGDRLSFNTRITEGGGCCSARIAFKNENNETSDRRGHRRRRRNGG